MRARCSSTCVFVATLLAFGVAYAAADAVPPALRACANVKENSERLTCYDRTIERLSSELTSVTARVTALSRDAGGSLIVNLDNGQQWLQTGGTSSPLLEVGHEVTITRAALNSFRLSTPSGRVLKVRRVL